MKLYSSKWKVVLVTLLALLGGIFLIFLGLYFTERAVDQSSQDGSVATLYVGAAVSYALSAIFLITGKCVEEEWYRLETERHRASRQ